MLELSRILHMLDRDGALELMDPDPERPDVPEGFGILDVDLEALFPPPRDRDRGNEDWDIYGGDWNLDEGVVGQISAEGGADLAESRAPEWDVWAWYQQIHFYGPDWGIYITQNGLLECAIRIARSAQVRLTYPNPNFAKSCLRAAFGVLFLHEQYHHKAESAAIRMHVVEQRPIYPAYIRGAYLPARGTPDQIEEGLANADSWFRMSHEPYKTLAGRTLMSATKTYLRRSFYTSAPPGYANAQYLQYKPYFDGEQSMLLAEMQEGRLTPRRLRIDEFSIATNLTKSLYTVTQPIWTIVPPGVRSVLPTKAPSAPLKTRKVERLVKKSGFEAVRGAGKGSHRKFTSPDGRMIILPDKNDISRGVAKSTAATLGIKLSQLEMLANSA